MPPVQAYELLETLAANTLTTRSSFQPCKNHQKGGSNFTSLHRENRETNFKMNGMEISGKPCNDDSNITTDISTDHVDSCSCSKFTSMLTAGKTSLNMENHVVDTDWVNVICFSANQ